MGGFERMRPRVGTGLNMCLGHTVSLQENCYWPLQPLCTCVTDNRRDPVVALFYERNPMCVCVRTCALKDNLRTAD